MHFTSDNASNSQDSKAKLKTKNVNEIMKERKKNKKEMRSRTTGDAGPVNRVPF